MEASEAFDQSPKRPQHDLIASVKFLSPMDIAMCPEGL